MPRKNDSSPKEIYRLWWEYLRRSPKYKKYCSKRSSLRPEELDIDLEKGFEKFGNIYTSSFNDWWKSRHAKKVFDERNVKIYGWPTEKAPKEAHVTLYGLIKPLEEYTEIIWEDFMRVFEDFKKAYNREPSFEEYFKIFPSFIRDYYPKSFFLKITINETYDIERIVNELKTFLNKMKKDSFSLQFWGLPTQPLRKDELSRYLKVYDLRNKKPKTKWKDILKIIYEKKAKEIPNAHFNKELSIKKYDKLLTEVGILERSLYKDLKKAKKIIWNVENGEFPGKY